LAGGTLCAILHDLTHPPMVPGRGHLLSAKRKRSHFCERFVVVLAVCCCFAY
jgi:hypothetical protein